MQRCEISPDAGIGVMAASGTDPSLGQKDIRQDRHVSENPKAFTAWKNAVWLP